MAENLEVKLGVALGPFLDAMRRAGAAVDAFEAGLRRGQGSLGGLQGQSQRAAQGIAGIMDRLNDQMNRATMSGVDYRIAQIRREAQANERAIRESTASSAEVQQALTRNRQVTEARITQIQQEEAAKRQAIANEEANQRKAAFDRVTMAAGVAFVALTAAIGGAAKTFGDFDKVIRTLGAVASLTSEELDRVRAAAVRIGVDTKFSTQEAAEAFLELGRAGLTATEQLQAMPGIVSLAASAAISLSDAAEIGAGAVRGFSLGMSDTTRVADVIAKTASSAALDVSNLAQSFKFVAPVAAASNQSLEEISTTLGLLGNNMLKGGIAGRALRASLISLQAPSKEAAETMTAIGLEVAGADGRMRPFTTILADLAERTKQFNEVSRTKIFATIFGQDAVSSIAAIVNTINKTPEALDKMRAGIDNASGAAKKMQDQIQQGLAAEVELFTGVLATSGQQLGEQFAPAITAVVTVLTKLLTAFVETSGGIKAVIASALGLATVVTGSILAFAGLAKAVSLAKDVALAAAAGFNLAAAAAARAQVAALAFIASPWAIAIAAIGALAIGYAVYRSRADEAAAAERRLTATKIEGAAKAKVAADTTKQLVAEYEQLRAKADRTAAEKARLKAITEQLIKLNPSLASEIGKVSNANGSLTGVLSQVAAAYRQVANEAYNAARAQAVAAKVRAGNIASEIANLRGQLADAEQSGPVAGEFRGPGGGSGNREAANLRARIEGQTRVLAEATDAANSAMSEFNRAAILIGKRPASVQAAPPASGGGGATFNLPEKTKGGGSSGGSSGGGAAAMEIKETEGLAAALKAIRDSREQAVEEADGNVSAIIKAYATERDAIAATGDAYAQTTKDKARVTDALADAEKGLTKTVATELKRQRQERQREQDQARSENIRNLEAAEADEVAAAKVRAESRLQEVKDSTAAGLEQAQRQYEAGRISAQQLIDVRRVLRQNENAEILNDLERQRVAAGDSEAEKARVVAAFEAETRRQRRQSTDDAIAGQKLINDEIRAFAANAGQVLDRLSQSFAAAGLESAAGFTAGLRRMATDTEAILGGLKETVNDAGETVLSLSNPIGLVMTVVGRFGDAVKASAEKGVSALTKFQNIVDAITGTGFGRDLGLEISKALFPAGYALLKDDDARAAAEAVFATMDEALGVAAERFRPADRLEGAKRAWQSALDSLNVMLRNKYLTATTRAQIEAAVAFLEGQLANAAPTTSAADEADKARKKLDAETKALERATKAKAEAINDFELGAVDDLGQRVSIERKAQLDIDKIRADATEAQIRRDSRRRDLLAQYAKQEADDAERIGRLRADLAKNFTDEEAAIKGILNEGIAERQKSVQQDKADRISEVREKGRDQRTDLERQIDGINEAAKERADKHKLALAELDAEELKAKANAANQILRIQNETAERARAHQYRMAQLDAEIAEANKLAKIDQGRLTTLLKIAQQEAQSAKGISSGGSSGGGGGSSGGGSSSGSGAILSGSFGTYTASAIPQLQALGFLPKAHTGGIIDLPGMRFPGLAADEVPIVAQAGEAVIPRNVVSDLISGRLPLATGGGGAVTIAPTIRIESFNGSQQNVRELSRLVAREVGNLMRARGNSAVL